MRKVALRGLLAHKFRLLSTLIAVVLGVAFVAGVLTLSSTMNSSFDDLFSTAFEGTDAVVRSSESVQGEFGETQRGTLPQELVEEVEALPTVAAAEPDVFDFAYVIGKDGEPYGAGAFGPPSYGGNWWEDDQLNSFDIREGEEPDAPGEVVLDAATADGTDYQVGDTVPIETKIGVQDFTLVGIAGFGNADSPAGAVYSLFTLDEAQELVGEPERVMTVNARATEGVSEEELVADIEAAIEGNELEVLTGAEITEEQQTDLKEQLGFFTVFLMIFAVVAVIVGGFVIYNSFSIIVAQRTSEMALLRALGATRRQVRRSVFIEAVIVGLVGSLVGFGLGLGIATGLVGLLQIEGSLVVQPNAFVVGLLVGVLVTVVSSLLPAWRASRVPPVAAMRQTAVDTTGRSPIRLGIGLVMCVVGLVLVVVGAMAEAIGQVGGGVALAFVGLIVAGPGLARPVSRVIGAPLGRMRGMTGRLAQRNAGRNPRRSAATAYAILIGVGLVAFVLVFDASVRSSINQYLDENYRGDFIVAGGNFGMTGLPGEIADDIRDLPETEEVAPLRFTQARVNGSESMVTGTFSDAFSLFGLETSGDTSLDEGQVVVLESEAESEGLTVGDEVTLDFLDSDEVTVTVAGTYDTLPNNEIGNYLLGTEEYDNHVSQPRDSQIMVKMTEGADLNDVKLELQEVVNAFPSADVLTVDDMKEQFASQLDQMLLLVFGLLAIAIIIAVFGIANTVALSVLERTRELGLLRAVGAHRAQVRSAIRWEALLIAVFGTVLGLVVGVLGGWGMVRALRNEGFEAFSLPTFWLVIVVLVAALVGMLAALVPAWRAGRLNILDAIRTE